MYRYRTTIPQALKNQERVNLSDAYSSLKDIHLRVKDQNRALKEENQTLKTELEDYKRRYTELIREKNKEDE